MAGFRQAVFYCCHKITLFEPGLFFKKVSIVLLVLCFSFLQAISSADYNLNGGKHYLQKSLRSSR